MAENDSSINQNETRKLKSIHTFFKFTITLFAVGLIFFLTVSLSAQRETRNCAQEKENPSAQQTPIQPFVLAAEETFNAQNSSFEFKKFYCLYLIDVYFNQARFHDGSNLDKAEKALDEYNVSLAAASQQIYWERLATWYFRCGQAEKGLAVVKRILNSEELITAHWDIIDLHPHSDFILLGMTAIPKHFLPPVNIFYRCLNENQRETAEKIYALIEKQNPPQEVNGLLSFQVELANMAFSLGKTQQAQKTLKQALKTANRIPRKFLAKAKRFLLEPAVKFKTYFDLDALCAEIQQLETDSSQKTGNRAFSTDDLETLVPSLFIDYNEPELARIWRDKLLEKWEKSNINILSAQLIKRKKDFTLTIFQDEIESVQFRNKIQSGDIDELFKDVDRSDVGLTINQWIEAYNSLIASGRTEEAFRRLLGTKNEDLLQSLMDAVYPALISAMLQSNQVDKAIELIEKIPSSQQRFQLYTDSSVDSFGCEKESAGLLERLSPSAAERLAAKAEQIPPEMRFEKEEDSPFTRHFAMACAWIRAGNAEKAQAALNRARQNKDKQNPEYEGTEDNINQILNYAQIRIFILEEKWDSAKEKTFAISNDFYKADLQTCLISVMISQSGADNALQYLKANFPPDIQIQILNNIVERITNQYAPKWDDYPCRIRLEKGVFGFGRM